MKEEIYFSIDIEADGPIPGIYSMLSLGCVAFDKRGKELGDFSHNFHQLPDAKTDPATMKWWESQPEAWEACRQNLTYAGFGMEDFVAWVNTFKGKPVAVYYPSGFDWPFVYYYLMAFAGKSPFGFQCLDMKTYASAILKSSFRDTVKRKMPKFWFNKKRKHTHIAVEDAREQGELFFQMKKYNDSLRQWPLNFS